MRPPSGREKCPRMQQDPGRTSLQRARSARARLRRPPPAAAAGDAPAVWDVVVYVEPPSAAPGGARRVRLGLVAETKGAMVMVEPLVVDADAAGGGGGDYAAGGVWWTHDEAAALDGPQAVALGEVLRVVEADYSQVRRAAALAACACGMLSYLSTLAALVWPPSAAAGASRHAWLAAAACIPRGSSASRLGAAHSGERSCRHADPAGLLHPPHTLAAPGQGGARQPPRRARARRLPPARAAGARGVHRLGGLGAARRAQAQRAAGRAAAAPAPRFGWTE